MAFQHFAQINRASNTIRAKRILTFRMTNTWVLEKNISNISLQIDATSFNRHHEVLTLEKVAMKTKVTLLFISAKH